MNFQSIRDVSFILGFLCFGYLGLSVTCNGQKNIGFSQPGDTLSCLMLEMSQVKNDSQRLRYNEIFTRVLYDFIQTQEAENYPLEKVKTLNRINSDDGSLTFFQWNILTTEGRFRYFGFLKVNLSDTKQIFTLTDGSDLGGDLDSAILSADNWFGALYYRIITCKDDEGDTFYTLLGWSGKDRQITRKVIEILSFDSLHQPVFGDNRFPDYKTGHFSRVVFMFDASSSMSLKYEDQSLSVTRKWDSAHRTFEEHLNEQKVLVFDHLIPIDPLLEGQYRYYVPSGETYSGFFFKGGNWHFLQKIDARNSVKKP
ncbi:MAG: hypothetical protein EOM90_06580 [Alphaproteobacteria bacterium]|nr:hypothetical protein [Alphaproteobacteria bacterium]